jgi:hypothetical protein
LFTSRELRQQYARANSQYANSIQQKCAVRFPLLRIAN